MRVLYFCADWCAPCKSFKPIVEAVCREKNVPLEVINVEDNISLANQYRVKGVPALVVVDSNSEEVFRTASTMSPEGLANTLGGLGL